MKVLTAILTISMAFLILQPIYAVADSTDQYIKDLKNDDPEVRAKAAFNLGCS